MKHISASQISMLGDCERKWLFRYVLQQKEPSNENFALGTAFHDVVDDPALLETHSLTGLNTNEYPYRTVIKKMVDSAALATSGLPPVKHKELKLEISEGQHKVLGFIDAVRVDVQGNWFLAERKTSGRIEEGRRELLHNETQVCTYVGAVQDIARIASLLPAKFQGLTYEVTEKPQERMGKKETLQEFGLRATARTVVWTVDASLAAHCRKVFLTNLAWASDRIEKLTAAYSRSKDVFDVVGNTGSCMKWGKKCSFFENCHGRVS
jgi:hypothetical protein